MKKNNKRRGPSPQFEKIPVAALQQQKFGLAWISRSAEVAVNIKVVVVVVAWTSQSEVEQVI